MNKVDFKKETLAIAKEKIQEIVSHFKKEIAQIQGSEMIIDQDQFDDTQQSQNEAEHEVMDNLATQLNFALDELRTLDRILHPEILLERVAFGSIVKTDKKTFFISVGIKEFPVNGHPVFGISTEAPIYESMRSKQKGVRFSFRDIDYLIEDVF